MRVGEPVFDRLARIGVAEHLLYRPTSPLLMFWRGNIIAEGCSGPAFRVPLHTGNTQSTQYASDVCGMPSPALA